MSLNMGEANAKKEHLSYSQLDNATLEMWAQSLNLPIGLQNRISVNLKKRDTVQNFV